MKSSAFQSLQISSEEAGRLTYDLFGIQANAKALAGEVDFNFRLKTAENTFYTLKISRPQVEVADLDFQAAIMRHLSDKALPFAIPSVIPDKQGKDRVAIKDAHEQQRWVRLQQWVDGSDLAGISPHSPELLYSWGKTCGHLSRALQDFDHPAAHRFYKWDPSETLYSRKFATYFSEQSEQALADYFWGLFETKALPHLPELRKSVNYNDAHEYNFLAAPTASPIEVSGVIDFGDALYTHTVNELAIACAYACMNKQDPLAAALHLVKGYHAVFPLTERELEVLFPMITARLMITVANAAFNKHQEPDNDYLQISARPAWKLLEQFRNISPAYVHYSFRYACGFEACPHKKRVAQWIEEQAKTVAELIPLEGKKICRLDLSVGSKVLGNNVHFEQAALFERRIRNVLESEEAEIGYGGYAEYRPVYTTDAYTVMGNEGPQWRSLHLGIDLWTAAGCPVFAPISGKIHSVQDNAGERDYGPTLILEHRIAEDLRFYSLYGHLDRASLTDWKSGREVAQGQQLGRIGPAPENGNWPPHLHFQLMLDLLGNEGDFPGVAFPNEAEIWLSVCPDPSLLIRGVPTTFPRSSVAASHILERRKQHLGKSLSVSYQSPLHIVRGYKQYLYDQHARRYLDTVNNVAHVGHEHPLVVQAAQQQMGLLNTNTRYLHAEIVGFAEELLSTFPPELCVVHFVNSGSEANELAIRMAKTWSSQQDMIAVEVGYHGNTGACIEVSSYKFDGKGGKGAPPHTQIVPMPDTYRGLYRNPEEAGKQYATHVDEAIQQVSKTGRNIAGFIGESILSCGGQIVLPVGYLQKVYPKIRAAGGLCIADEVQVGLGRVGSHFWGF